jgi:hypothetical protein
MRGEARCPECTSTVARWVGLDQDDDVYECSSCLTEYIVIRVVVTRKVRKRL